MNIAPKSPQEMAAQLLDTYPYFSGADMPEEHAEVLTAAGKQLRESLEEAQPSTLSDEALTETISTFYESAQASGVWQPIHGAGAEQRLNYATEKMLSYGYPEEQAALEALQALSKQGYLKGVRWARKDRDRAFTDPIRETVAATELEPDQERQRVAELLERTIDIETMTDAERERIAHDFPSSNFMYHGSTTERLLRIFQTGDIASMSVLTARDKNRGLGGHNSGNEGISWSFNAIDALPGDRYHLAGFVAAPEKLLTDEYQLAIPSRPSPYEVIMIDAEIDAPTFYESKTQEELLLGANSVLSDLINTVLEDELPTSSFLVSAEKLSDEAYVAQLDELCTIQADGSITLSPDLLSQQGSDRIPMGTVWLNALTRTNRLADTSFAGMSAEQIIPLIDNDTIKQLYGELKKDAAKWNVAYGGEHAPITAPVEQMYFVAPRKDAAQWLRALARSEHQPAGILLYDGSKVRLENFASMHRGDHGALTEALQAAIPANKDMHIGYDAVLGTKFDDSMRAGTKQHVIAERYLTGRKTMHLADGELVVS